MAQKSDEVRKMAQSDGTQKYDVSIFVDKEMFDRQMAEVNAKFERIGKTAETAGNGIDNTFKKIGAGVAAYFAVGQIQNFVKEVVNVRSEFQKLEVSFTSLLGSAEKGKKMFSDITAFATSTPLLEKDLASAAQTLLGFNIEAEKVMPLLQQIGDVSMGDSQKFQSLTLAFAQASSTGKLMGQDLLQMINAGFNPLAEISRTTGRSISELKDEMSKGNITVEMLEGAFRSATSEGGKFNGMLEAQSKTLAGAISNLEGAVQKLMNDVGEGIEEPIINGTNKAIEAVNWLAENLANVERALTALMVTFGTYKAACLAVSSGLTSLTITEALHYNWLVLCEKAQKLLNATMLKNPYVLAAVAIGTLVASVIDYVQQANKADEATKRLNDSSEKFEAEAAKERAEIDKLFDELRHAKEGTDEYKKAKDAIISQYGSYLQGLSDEVRSLKNVEAAYIAVTKAARESAKARAMQGALGSAQEAYGKNYAENMNPLTNYLTYYDQKNGGEEGLKLLNMAKEQLTKTGKIALKTQNDIRNLLKDTPGFSESANWFANLEKGEKRLRFETQRASELFAPESKDDVEVEEKKWSVEIAEKREQLKQKERELAELKKSGTTKQVNAKQKEIDDLKKDLKDNGYNSDKESSNAKKADALATRAAKEEAQRQQKYADAVVKQDEELAKKRSQLALQTEQARIDQMADGSKKAIRQIELDYQKELAAIELAEDDMLREQTEMARKRWEAQNTDKKKTWENTGWHKWQEEEGGAKLSIEQKNLLEEREKAAKVAHDRSLEAQRRADTQYMLDYLLKYGDAEEKRLAITKLTELKIAEAKDEWAKKFAKKEGEEALRSATIDMAMESIKNNPNYVMAMQDPTVIATEGLQKLYDKLSDASDALKDLPADQLQTIANLMGTINEEIVSRNPFIAMKQASEEYVSAQKEVASAQQEVYDATVHQSMMIATYGKDSKQAENATTRLTNAKNRLANATNKEQRAETKVKSARDKTIQSLNKLAQAVASVGNAVGGEIGAVLNLITGISTTVMTAIEGMKTASETASGAMKAIETASVILAAISAAIELATKAADLLGFSKDDSQYNKAKDTYNALNDIWDSLIDKKKEYLDISWGSEINGARAEIQALYGNKEVAARNLGREYLQAGASGGSHSYGVRMDKDLARFFSGVSQASGSSVSSVYDLLSLSPEQLQKVKEQQFEFWARLHSDFRGYLEDIIAGQEALDEFNQSVQEKYAQISFDSMYDEFVDSLMDMDKSASDYANDISEKFARALLAQEIGAGYRNQLEDWYGRYTKDLELNNGRLTDSELDAYREEYMGYVNEALQKRNDIARLTGYGASSSEAEGTINSAMSMSEDTGNQIVGRTTAVQIAAERIALFSEELTTNARDMASKVASGLMLIEENNSLTQRCAQHLESISEYTSVLPFMSEELSRLRTITEQKL